MSQANYFVQLNNINVNDKTEKKNGFTYLSWASAWGKIKKRYPDATYTVYENKDGLNYHHDGCTAWVKTGVTVNGIEHIEYLPVMDCNNKSITLANITSFDVNKAIQRSLTKACARHGLGLYIYEGKEFPDEMSTTAEEQKARPRDPAAEIKAFAAGYPGTQKEAVELVRQILSEFGYARAGDVQIKDLDNVLLSLINRKKVVL